MADLLNVSKLEDKLRADQNKKRESKSLRQQLAAPAPAPETAPPAMAIASPVVSPPAASTPKPAAKSSTPGQMIAPALKTGSIDELFKKIDAYSQKELAASEPGRKLLEDKINEIKSRVGPAFDEYNKAKDTAETAELAELIGHALLQLGAGAYGLKHNVDMSGLKFDKHDWSKNIDRAAAELDRKLGRIDDDTAGAEKDLGAFEKKLRENRDFRRKVLLRDYFTNQRRADQQVARAQRLAERAQAAPGRSVEEKRAAKAAEKERNRLIKEKETELKLYDKALAEQMAVLEDAKGANQEKVFKVLGGIKGEKVREEATKSRFFGLMESLDPEAAMGVLKARHRQTKDALKKMRGGDILPEEPAAASGPKPGDIIDGYKFLGGDPAEESNYEKVD